MVDSDYSIEDYKSSKSSNRAILKDPKMLTFVTYHLEIKKEE